jgi:hypothetical protein
MLPVACPWSVVLSGYFFHLLKLVAMIEDRRIKVKVTTSKNRTKI